jgi:hypothetical protein
LSIPLGPFRIFSKIRGDIRSSMCTTGVVDTSGKWKKSSIIKMANLPPVSLIPVVHLNWRISLRIFEKIQTGPKGILWAGGKLIHEKRSKISRETVPLKTKSFFSPYRLAGHLCICICICYYIFVVFWPLQFSGGVGPGFVDLDT